MDHAVSLVQAYLQVNGYFTVAEYPVLEATVDGGYQSATDIDLLALRLADAGGVVPADRVGRDRTARFEPDPELQIPSGKADLLIIEVKEGRAELNRGARNPEILSAVLRRFGFCPHARVERALVELRRTGETAWPGGTSVRMFAFGSILDPKLIEGFRAISLQHVITFLQRHMERNWSVLRHAQIKHEALGFLALLEQVRQTEDR